MTPSRMLPSRFLQALVVLLALLLGGLPLATAQDDNPAQQVEVLALRAHLQNLRTGSRTLWIGGSLGASGARPPSPLGERFDPFVLPGLGESSEFDSIEIERPVLLNFWASWCTPCRVEFPHLADVALNEADHTFDVVFVNTADTEADALGFLLGQPLGLHTVADASGRLARRSLLGTIPTSLLVDTDGTVLVVHLGVVTPTITAFLDAVAAHPGEGMFDASTVEDEKPGAVLEPFDVALAREIQLGERALGTLTDDDFQHAYRFEGRAGQRIRVEMAADSSELDPYLVVMTADGTRLAENDDTGASVDAALEVRLPAEGPVIIVATRFLEAEGFSTGDYSLIVRDPTQTVRDGFLSCGAAVAGRVSSNNPRTRETDNLDYTLTLSAAN